MKNERFILYTLAAIQFTHIVDFMILMPLGPQLMRVLEINPKEFGLLVSSYTFSAAAIGFLGAFFLDKLDRKKALLWFYTGFLIGTFLCGIAEDFLLLTMARIFTGAFGGILTALTLSIISDVVPEERRAGAMGIVTAAFSAASVFGVPMGLYFSNLFDWHAPFLFLSAFSLLVLLLIVKYIPSMSGHKMKTRNRLNPFQMFKRNITLPNQRNALLFLACLMLGQFSVIPYLSPFLVANVGFSEGMLTYIYLLGGFATIFTAPFFGKTADKVGKKKVVYVLGFISLIPLFAMTHLVEIHYVYVYIITTVFMVFISGRMIPSMAIITTTVLPENRGSFMSITSSVQQLTAGIASYVSGVIIVESASGRLENYNYVGYLAIFFSLIAFWLLKSIHSVNRQEVLTEAV